MSILREVLSNLGFNSRIIGYGTNFQEKLTDNQVQKAFLENLHIAGYFNEEEVKQAVNLIRREHHNAHDSFAKIMEILHDCGASKKDSHKFNAEILFESFAKNSRFLNEIDLKNIIIFLARKAFGRKKGQERNELQQQLWAEIYRHLYLENAKKLGLILEEKPSLEKYHETWIQGAAYPRMKARTIYAKKLRDEGYDLGVIRLLSGERELWLEIDDLSKDEIFAIAKRNNIAVVGFEERMVNNSVRTYGKYAENEHKKITEGVIAREIYLEVFGVVNDELVIDAAMHKNEVRATTASVTASFVHEKFAQKIINDFVSEKELNILIVTNQPYVERQTLTNKRAALGELRKLNIKKNINFYGVGASCTSSIAEIHSEFGALVSEKYMQQVQKDKQHMIKTLRKISQNS
jgi:hypothetical protein